MSSSQKTYPNQVGGQIMLKKQIEQTIRRTAAGRTLTSEGMSFLKCAFAPPDFSFTGDNGIPDGVTVRRNVYKHRLTSAFTFAASTDYYFLILPTPGYAYWVASVAAGTPIVAATVFQGVPYADYARLYGTLGQETNNVVKYRYVSNVMEFVPTANQMTWSGNLQVFKTPITSNIKRDVAFAGQIDLGLSGIESLNATNADMYQAPFTDGAYSMATSSEQTFKFTPIWESEQALPNTFQAGDFGQLAVTTNNPAGGVPGLADNFDCICFKVSGVTATETGYLRTWACVEYTPQITSLLFNSSGCSDVADPLALEIYREVAKMLPIAVCYKDNNMFWERVLGAIKALTAAGVALPGKYGMISGGANAIITGIEGLLR